MSYLPFSQGGILSITGNYRYRISQYGFLFDKKKQTKNTCSDGSFFFNLHYAYITTFPVIHVV